MLFIKSDDGRRWGQSWHVGDPLPTIKGQVVQFQADGNELEVIMEALNLYSWKGPKVSKGV